LSSRNRYLTAEERAAAPALHGALQAVREAFDRGERATAKLAATGREKLARSGAFRLDYLEVRDDAARTAAPSRPRGEAMLLREMMRAKIHGIVVTDKNLHYTGSLGIDGRLLDSAGILHNEKIQVINLANGERMETYALRSEPGSGACVLNGGMAKKG